MQQEMLINSKVREGDFKRGGEVSSKLKETLKQLDLDSKTIRKASIVAYELEMNIIIHSQGGRLKVKISPEEVLIIAEDSGPGIEDIEKALTPGFSTAGNEIRELGFGAGMGLCNVNKFSDKMDIESDSEGTVVRAGINF
ncbi:ATP-binding protein [Halanaerobiaceae bacterium Z-7014]|uniref:ATP-binding protein n=1 Tax=Halonatronomonas betaini TaxID=2778430 RepID=A0A931ATT9_9FIRM|nr:ATP-binding protein [Halonatronomonas betaini]MBF8438064.1 ATP-binding protein [Halonatronomonas betaini]